MLSCTALRRAIQTHWLLLLLLAALLSLAIPLAEPSKFRPSMRLLRMMSPDPRKLQRVPAPDPMFDPAEFLPVPSCAASADRAAAATAEVRKANNQPAPQPAQEETKLQLVQFPLLSANPYRRATQPPMYVRIESLEKNHLWRGPVVNVDLLDPNSVSQFLFPHTR